MVILLLIFICLSVWLINGYVLFVCKIKLKVISNVLILPVIRFLLQLLVVNHHITTFNFLVHSQIKPLLVVLDSGGNRFSKYCYDGRSACCTVATVCIAY